AKALTHPYGCSQLGGDLEITQKTLADLIVHPNAGGVLVLGLGCENNNVASLKKHLKNYDGERVKFLVCQECEDEIEEGVKIIEELKNIAAKDEKTPVPLSKLRVGLKCGGSDGLSGITANPLVGKFTNKFVAMGGTCVLTEVPEMFGAERILMNRCKDRETFDKTVKMINGFKSYFSSHGQPITENPSPGNKDGGITTIEEKSLGCIQKAGFAPVNDVLDYGETVKEKGLSLLNGPGNDIVSMTNLFAASCHMILFTTGRGTPLGSFVPTVKISSNEALAKKKPHWIDFDASPALDGKDLGEEFFEYVVSVASGEKTKNEIASQNEIAIFKDGVIL
ncbi:MAG: UxaA family hydrolase, partial [Clostridia bacterium]|nr:UxaA family hydrolase [Clostridia bacterium]